MNEVKNPFILGHTVLRMRTYPPLFHRRRVHLHLSNPSFQPAILFPTLVALLQALFVFLLLTAWHHSARIVFLVFPGL